MFGQYLIAFREAFEAALITATIFLYLSRKGERSLIRYMLYGITLAIVASLSLAVFIWFSYGALSETSQLLFEALAALIAVAVLSSVVYWMSIKATSMKKEIENRINRITTKGNTIGFVSLGFVVVFREGFETVLFLTPFLVDDVATTLIGGFLGIFAATILAYGIFIFGMKINLQKFFYFTSLMLILLAGGLAGYGTHELLEYYEKSRVSTGWLDETAFNLNIPSNSPFHHEGLIGSILAVMFGYTTSAEWARIIVHSWYLAIMLPLIFWSYRKHLTTQEANAK